MRCTLADQFWRSPRKPTLLLVLCGAILLALGADLALAQAKTDAKIAVICRGAGDISPETLNGLCLDLQNALAAVHPEPTFVRADAIPKGGSAFVALEALSATAAALEAQLTWQTARSMVITGPRISFSVTDKDLTPAMQVNFLNRLVHASELPF